MKNLLLGSFQIENAVNKEDTIEFEGFACHFNKANLNNEIVDAASFNTFFKMYEDGRIKPKLNYNHTDMLIGGIREIISMDEGLYMSAYLNNKIALVRDMIGPSVMAGELNQMSTEGYIMNGYDGIVEHDNGQYYVKDFLLVAVAVVPTPADPDATFTLKNYLAEYAAKKAEEKEEIEKNSRKVYLLV